MSIKSYMQFLTEEQDPLATPAAPAAPPAAQAPAAQPAAPAAQPAAQPQTTGGTETQAPAQPQQGQGEQKSGDLSNYDNPDATKFSDTVKKMVDIIKELDKNQLIELRDLLAKFKSIEDAKAEIGKL